ncbi:glucosidase II beta subunit-like-domain-containing protein, partial [Baffinella frigidus]
MRFAISAGGLGAAVFALLVHSAAANTPATKGVHPDQITLYSGPGDFDCADGSGKISMAQVNDEYCDCSDGSDEPGTSACQNGKFWCKNFQHRGLYLFSSRVNDGVCDCCDGSDEHNGVAVCEDRCAEEGREIREALVKKIDLLEQGILKRPEYVERATSFKQGIETRTAELTKTIQETEEKMNEKQKTIDELQKVVDGEKEARAPEEGEKRRSVEVRQKLRQDVRDARRAHELAVKHQLEEVARAAQLVKDAEQAPPQGEGGGEEVHAAQD